MNSAHLDQAGISSPALKLMFARRLHAGKGFWTDTKRRRSVLALHRAVCQMGSAVASQAQGASNPNLFTTAAQPITTVVKWAEVYGGSKLVFCLVSIKLLQVYSNYAIFYSVDI